MGEGILMNSGFYVHRDIDVDAPIYRFFAKNFFDEVLGEKKLYFHKVSKWEDTWEIPSRFFDEDNKLLKYIGATKTVAEGLFGECWSSIEESDALWRIYSGKDKSAVCIKSTTRKLFQAINWEIRKEGFLDGFMAPVRYKDIETTFEPNPFFDEEAGSYIRNMIPAFIKRTAFEHEKEIRFIIHNPFAGEGIETGLLTLCNNGNGMKIPLKDLNFIEKVILDPRSNTEEVKELTQEYNKFHVVKSTLYDIPEKIYTIQSTPEHYFELRKDAKIWMGNDFREL